MSSYKTLPTPGDTAWFTHDRFGMFIHFGLYAMPARHEWVKNYEEIPEDHYDLYFKHFNPDLYDPKEWARQAKAAGMKYVVMTTKHHEGFCLFDSKYTDYKSTNTLCGKDLIREYVDAFRAEGLHIGFYYSLIDWHHPEFPIDPLHPRRDDPDAYEQSKGRDIKKYSQYMRDQVTELLTNYGKIDILWFDFSYSQNNGTGDKAWQKGKGKDDWEAEKLIATARALQPHIIIDNRTEIDQDLWTPMKNDIIDVMEACVDGTLDTIDLQFEDNACVCVVLASDGYPVKYEKGFKITGFEKFDGKDDYYCYHAGTKFDDDGNIVTNGGRVLGITATGATLKEARAKAYEATEWVQFDNKYMRHDIGKAIDEA